MGTSGNGKKRGVVEYGSCIHAPAPKKYNHGKNDFIGRKKSDPKPILYLSGTPGSKLWSEAEFTEYTGCYFRCFSYAYTGPDSPLRATRHVEAMDWCLQNGVRVFMDSGAHSFHNFRNKGSGLARKTAKADVGSFVDQIQAKFAQGFCNYMKWCYSQKKYFDFYVTFDAMKRCKFIWEMTEWYYKQGIYPVPVYHGDAPITWLERYIDAGHKLVGVGIDKVGKGSSDGVRRYYDAVHTLCYKRGVLCHGFALTGDLMFQFPWYSVDSTTWLKAASYGKIMDVMPEKQRIATIHISSQSAALGYGTVEGLSPDVVRYLRDKVEREGLDFDRLRVDQSQRMLYNGRVLTRAVALHSKRPLQWASWESVIK